MIATDNRGSERRVAYTYMSYLAPLIIAREQFWPLSHSLRDSLKPLLGDLAEQIAKEATDEEFLLTLLFNWVKYFLPHDKIMQQQMRAQIVNARKQMEGDALEITPDQQVKLPERAIVLFTRLAANRAGSAPRWQVWRI